MLGLTLLMLSQTVSQPAAAPSARYVMDVAEGKIVCRRETEAHSRIPIRICRTELQWEDMARENQRDIRIARNRGL